MRGEDEPSDPLDTSGEAAELAPAAVHAVAVAVVCLAGVLAYAPGLDGGFVLDDVGNIPENPHIRMSELGVAALWEAAFESRDPTRPVANATLALNYWWGGYAVRGYHVFNLAVHLATSVAVYLLALGLLMDARGLRNPQSRPPPGPLVPLATAAALLFVVHPVQTQAVTYIIQRMTSLATLFTLIALLAWLAGRRVEGRQRWLWWGAATGAWLLALASKPIAITLPLLVLLYEWFFLQDLSQEWLRARRRWLAIAAACAFAALGLVLATSGILEGYDHRDFTLGERLLTQPRVVVQYLGLVAFPHPTRLSLDHTLEASHSLLDPPTTVLSMIALAALLGASIVFAPRWRIASFAVLWLFVNLALESTFVPLEMMFEHRLYLPLVGPCIWAGQAFFRLVPGHRAFTTVAIACVVLTLGHYARERNRHWETPIRIWSDAVAKSPNSYRAHYNLGVHLRSDGHTREAAGHFARSAELRPSFAKAHNNLGVALGELGQLEAAQRELERAIALDPGMAEAHHSLGTALRLQGQLEQALVHYREALRLAPDDPEIARALTAAQREAESRPALPGP